MWRCCWWAPPQGGPVGFWRCLASGLCLRDTGTCSGRRTRLHSGSLRRRARTHSQYTYTTDFSGCQSVSFFLIASFIYPTILYKTPHVGVKTCVRPDWTDSSSSLFIRGRWQGRGFGASSWSNVMMLVVLRAAGTKPCHIAVITTSDLFHHSVVFSHPSPFYAWSRQDQLFLTGVPSIESVWDSSDGMGQKPKLVCNFIFHQGGRGGKKSCLVIVIRVPWRAIDCPRIDSFSSHEHPHGLLNDWIQRMVPIIVVQDFRECLILVFMCERKGWGGERKRDK